MDATPALHRIAMLRGMSNPAPMNYRHAFHAGNFADVVKHAALVALLAALKVKPKPFCYVDTHAGRGWYDLGGEAALKTGEADGGIRRLLTAPHLPPELAAYVAVLRHFNADAPPAAWRTYPGSPLIAQQVLRPTDRAVVCELQAEEAAALRAALRGDPRFHLHQRDGYEALGALLPPAEKRGVVLIDPPFEAQAAEFRIIEAALAKALARWPTGCYAVWYPIKLGRDVEPFQRWLARQGFATALAADFLLHEANTALRLNGCGLAVINPPWHFASHLAAIQRALLPLLAPAGRGSQRVQSLGSSPAA